MLKLLFNAINVKPEEEGKVLLLLGNGFFMGVFMATYQIASETLFISNTVLQNYIREGIFAAAVLGVIATAIYAYLQNKISYSKLVIINLIVIFSVSISLFFLINVASQEYYNIVIFALYAMKGPLIALILLGFWGVFGRMFDLRQSKRIIGGIDIGQLSAVILTFFAVGFGFVVFPQTEDLLIYSGLSAIMSLLFLLAIVKKYDLELVMTSQGGATRTSYNDMLKSKYIILLILFISFSIVALLFVETSYLSVLSDQYPEESEKELTKFLGWFNGSIFVLSLIFQTFFVDKIIANYGLKVSLLISPIVLILFTILSVLTGAIYGFEVSSPTFFWFFLFIALSKLFYTFLREAMENPAFKLYFMPLENRIRFDIQVKVEGLFSEIAKLIAGSVILLLGLLTFFELIHYSFILILIAIAWLYVTGKLYNEYRNRIKLKLESQDVSSASLLKVQNVIIDELEQELGNNSPENAIFSYKLLEKIDPGAISQSINKLMRHDNNDVREYAQFKMNEIRGLSVSEDYIISFGPARQLSNGKNIVTGLDLETLLKTGEISKIRISKLSKSVNINDRLYAAELIGNATNKETTTYLLELLHDINPKVRTAAINAAEKNYDNEVLNGLIDNLDSPIYSNLALNSLLVIGENSFRALESEFYKAGQNVQVMLKIVQIYGRIGGPKAIELLWNKIDYPDKILVTQVLTSLGDCGFKASVNQITRIKYAIESDVEDIAWNLAAIDEIPDNQIGKQLREAVREENTHDIDHIYTLLAMLYDAKSIQLVKQNIESGTNDGVTYAIELLDVFLSEDLKEKMIPVLDDISENEKARKLEILFPRQELGAKEVLKYLINRDFNQTNRWSKACAIQQIGMMKIDSYLYDLIANLFNPDPLVMEISARSIYQINQEQYHLHTKRLGADTNGHLYLQIYLVWRS